VPPGSEGLLFLPYLTGERTPHGDPNARGVYFGLSLRHQRPHLVRSVVEGVTYALADSVAIMRDLGIEVGAVRATGGGARSALWRQIQADVLEASVRLALTDAGPAFGAAVLAGVGVGVFATVAEATDRLVQIREEVLPDAARSAIYRHYRALFDSLYPALADRFRALAGLVGSA
jgi:xylulokinase